MGNQFKGDCQLFRYQLNQGSPLEILNARVRARLIDQRNHATISPISYSLDDNYTPQFIYTISDQLKLSNTELHSCS